MFSFGITKKKKRQPQVWQLLLASFQYGERNLSAGHRIKLCWTCAHVPAHVVHVRHLMLSLLVQDTVTQPHKAMHWMMLCSPWRFILCSPAGCMCLGPLLPKSTCVYVTGPAHALLFAHIILQAPCSCVMTWFSSRRMWFACSNTWASMHGCTSTEKVRIRHSFSFSSVLLPVRQHDVQRKLLASVGYHRNDTYCSQERIEATYSSL